MVDGLIVQGRRPANAPLGRPPLMAAKGARGSGSSTVASLDHVMPRCIPLLVRGWTSALHQQPPRSQRPHRAIAGTPRSGDRINGRTRSAPKESRHEQAPHCRPRSRAPRARSGSFTRPEDDDVEARSPDAVRCGRRGGGPRRLQHRVLDLDDIIVGHVREQFGYRGGTCKAKRSPTRTISAACRSPAPTGRCRSPRSSRPATPAAGRTSTSRSTTPSKSRSPVRTPG